MLFSKSSRPIYTPVTDSRRYPFFFLSLIPLFNLINYVLVTPGWTRALSSYWDSKIRPLPCPGPGRELKGDSSIVSVWVPTSIYLLDACGISRWLFLQRLAKKKWVGLSQQQQCCHYPPGQKGGQIRGIQQQGLYTARHLEKSGHLLSRVVGHMDGSCLCDSLG